MPYNHTQIGKLMIAMLIGLLIFYGSIFAQTGFEIEFGIIMAIILFILASFSSLTVTINQGILKVKFGYGIFQKSFQLSQIRSAEKVKNKWYYGYGIRFWRKPTMWIYNVAGLDAIEIITSDNKRYRIGTDEPHQLEIAIKTNLKL